MQTAFVYYFFMAIGLAIIFGPTIFLKAYDFAFQWLYPLLEFAGSLVLA